jgi:hypothetical protein
MKEGKRFTPKPAAPKKGRVGKGGSDESNYGTYKDLPSKTPSKGPGKIMKPRGT